MGLPYACNSGSCGVCQIELLEGEVLDLWPQSPGLDPRARDRGRRLACQSVPSGDCRIKIRCREEFKPAVQPAIQQAKLLARRPLTPDMALFTFQTPQSAEFLPGQYAMLNLPGVAGDRAYSMCNLPNASGIWEFIIKRQPGGAGGLALFERLSPCTAVQIDGPYGNAYLRACTGRAIICIAGGSGLSPILSILREAAGSSSGGKIDLTLLYGGRRAEDIYSDRLLSEAGLASRVHCLNAISDESGPTPESFHPGHIHELLSAFLEDHPEPRSCDYYFSGPAPMVDAVQKLLLIEKRVPNSQLFFDSFS